MLFWGEQKKAFNIGMGIKKDANQNKLFGLITVKCTISLKISWW